MASVLLAIFYTHTPGDRLNGTGAYLGFFFLPGVFHLYLNVTRQAFHIPYIAAVNRFNTS